MGLLELWGDWLWFAGVALALATSLISIVYILSGFLMNEKMRTWAKMELVEVFYSALIIGFAIFGVQAIDAVVQGSLGVENTGGAPGGGGNFQCLGSVTSAWIPTTDYGNFGSLTYRCLDICGEPIAAEELSVYHGIESCHMRLGIWYLREIFTEAKDFAFQIYLDYIKTSMLAEFTINIEFLFEKAGFFTFTPWRGFFTMGNTIKELCFDWAMKIMTITKFQEILLRFIATAFFPAFFVIGAILRTFTFTRRLGGLLLAMAIALYFIFPAFYAFGALVMLDLKDKAYDSWIHNTDANPHGINDPDPPVANTMYVTGDFSMIGGSGTFSTQEAVDRLRYYEGMPPDQYYEAMEAGGSDEMPLSGVDLSADRSDTEEEQREALESATESGESWFNTVSSQSKIDELIDFAWEPNGPVETLSRLTFWSLFFSLFSVIGTIAAIRSLSMTFGGDIEIAGLTRLI
ncbi:hypothetical protein KKB44_06460 [Candidatus Micrarchaeota archaeon]|nr:hypothetical protein [Candidatus Micrarchaeota archaeon]